MCSPWRKESSRTVGKGTQNFSSPPPSGKADQSLRRGVVPTPKRISWRRIFPEWVRKWRPRKLSGKPPRALVWVAVVCLVLLMVCGGAFWYFARGLPDVRMLRHFQPPQKTLIYDRNGVLIGELFKQRRSVVPLRRIPRVMVLSVLAAEDADFYEHEGMDIPGIVRIFLKTLTEGRATQGASTITQQLVKNVLLTPERTVARKVRELILSRRVESEFSKDEILHLYLNYINFGHGRYGVQEAAKFYFGKNVQDLDMAEASLLAGIPQAPSRLSPIDHPEEAEHRRRFILSQLEEKREQHWPDLTVEEIALARERQPRLVPWVSSVRRVPEIIPLVREQLREILGVEKADRGGFRVYTTLDLSLQRGAREMLQKGLMAHDRRRNHRVPFKRRRLSDAELDKVASAATNPKGRSKLSWGQSYSATVLSVDTGKRVIVVAVQGEIAHMTEKDIARYNPDGHLPFDKLAKPGARLKVVLSAKPKKKGRPALVMPDLGPQGAVCVLDVKSRDVLALVSGYKARPGFNRATQALRQPGSTFKPFVYALGLKSRKFTPASVVIEARDVPSEDPDDGEDTIHKGPVLLRMALARSINRVALKVIEEVGPEEVAEFVRMLGIKSDLEVHVGLALGSSEVRVDEITNAYATFPNSGRSAPMRLIQKIVGPDGKPVPIKTQSGQEVLTPAEAYLSTSLMTSVVSRGTGGRARLLERPAAGKTGTSNDARDAWFLGFTPEVVAGVWVGYDDFRPLGEEEGGQQTALPIWVDVMQLATEGRPKSDFEMPSGVVRARIDPETGLRAYDGMEGAITEYFLKGTVPRRLDSTQTEHASQIVNVE